MYFLGDLEFFVWVGEKPPRLLVELAVQLCCCNELFQPAIEYHLVRQNIVSINVKSQFLLLAGDALDRKRHDLTVNRVNRPMLFEGPIVYEG